MKHLFLIGISVLALKAQNESLQMDLNGEFRLRSNFRTINSQQNSFHEMRSRLALRIQKSEEIQLLLQLQDSRWLGSNPQLNNAKNADFHQAFIQINQFLTDPLTFKAGRFEQTFSNQRLIGNVGFSNVGRSFDGAMLQYKSHAFVSSLFQFRIFEASNPNSIQSFYDSDRNDINLMGFHQSFFQEKNYQFDLYFFQNKFFASEFSKNYIGYYAKYFYDEFIIQSELDYLFGKETVQMEYQAYLVNLAVEYKLNHELKFHLGAEIVSGNDSTSRNKNEAFEMLYPTQHKFNGSMDYFYTGLSTAVTHDASGLKDIFLGLTYQKWQIVYHHFMADKTGFSKKKKYGSEIDLQYNYPYNQELTFEFFAGSFFFADFKNSSKSNDYYFYMAMTYSF